MSAREKTDRTRRVDLSLLVRRGGIVLLLLVLCALLAGAGWRQGKTGAGSLELSIGSLAPGDSVVITFDVEIAAEPPFEDDHYQLTSQGLLLGANGLQVPTDDPDTPEADDATVTVVVPGVVPVVVSDLSAVASPDGFRLTWSLVGQDADIIGILVQRAEAQEGPYVDRNASPLRLEQTGAFEDPAPADGATWWYRLVLVGRSGERIPTHSVSVTASTQGLETGLYTPSVMRGGAVHIRYSIGARPTQPVQLQLFDVAGRLVRQQNLGSLAPGRYVTEWDRRDASGVRVARGIYIVRLVVDGRPLTRKLVLVH
jgi:hypothetical protein